MIKNTTIAYVAACIVICIWSGWIILSRMAVQTDLTPSDVTLLRFGSAAILTLPFSLRYNWSKVKLYQILIVSLGCGFPYTMLSFIGLKTIKAANAGVLVNGMLPVTGLIFAYFWFKESISWQKIVAVSILLVANLLMMRWDADFSIIYVLGALALLGAALVFSSYMAALKRWKFTMKDVISIVPITNALLFIPIWFLLPSSISESSIQNITVQILYQGVLVSIIALLLITYTVSIIGSSTTSVFLSFVPACTAIFAYIILGEALSNFELAGIVLCSIGLTIYAKSK